MLEREQEPLLDDGGFSDALRSYLKIRLVPAYKVFQDSPNTLFATLVGRHSEIS